MADNVKIDFVSNDAALKTTIAELEQLGKVDKANADQFKKTNADNVSASQKRLDLIKQETLLISDLEKAKKKAFDPDAIRAYNDDIKRAKDNISTLKGETDKLDKSSGNFLSTLKGVGAAIGIAFGTQQLISFGKEAVALAAKGEGIRTAFARIGDDKVLEKLRIATRGATSDIDLMAAALRGKNFGIGTDLLAKGLELAGKVARQTGQDVTYLTDSFVDGLGRKSIRILDNLQISQVALQKEIKKTGDFNTAVGNIVNEKLKSMGEVAETTADKLARLSAMGDNLKEAFGAGLIDQFDKVSSGIRALFSQDERVNIAKKGISEITNISAEAYKKLSHQERENTLNSLLLIKNKNLLQVELLKAYTKVTDDENRKVAKSARELTDEELKAIEETKRLKKENRRNEIQAEKDGAAEGRKIAEQFLKESEEALKLSSKEKIQITEDGSKERLDAEIKAIEDLRDFQLDTTETTEQGRLNIIKEADIRINELRLKDEEDFVKEKAKADHEEFQRQKELNDEKLKQEHEFQQEKQKLTQQLEEEGFNLISELNNRVTTDKLNNLDIQLKQGIISEEEFDKRSRQIKRKAAQHDKEIALFKIAIQTAENVTKYTGGLPLTAPLLALAVAVGAVQAGVVLAQPIPFAKGTKSVNGGVEGKDSVHALLMPGEMVVPTNTKKRYQPILNAIFDEQISPDLLNAMALKGDMKLGSKSLSQYEIKEGMASALRNGIMIKNMPNYERGLTVDELRFLTRRGLA